MEWHTLLIVMLSLNDPAVFSLGSPSLTVGLIAVAGALGLLARRMSRRREADELELLHQLVDQARRQLREAALRGEPSEDLEVTLERLRRKLPEDDLRRL
jgi:hypothetical protein